MPLAGHHRTDQGQPGGAGDVRQHLGSLDIHLVPRLWPVLEMRRPLRQQGRPMTPGGPPGPPRGLRATRAAQQAPGRQRLHPLPRLHSALAPRHVRELARLAEVDPDPPRCQTLRHRKPRHARRVPRHRLQAADGQPVRQGIAVRGTGAQGSYRLGSAVCGHTRPALLAATSHPGRVRVHTGARVRGGELGRRARRVWPPSPGDIVTCRPAQDPSIDPAQRGRRPARATPPLLTAGLTRTSLVSGLSPPPVAARSELVCMRATRRPPSAPVSALAPPAQWYGTLVIIPWVCAILDEGKRDGCPRHSPRHHALTGLVPFSLVY
jgi:hypothetical protein